MRDETVRQTFCGSGFQAPNRIGFPVSTFAPLMVRFLPPVCWDIDITEPVQHTHQILGRPIVVSRHTPSRSVDLVLMAVVDGRGV